MAKDPIKSGVSVFILTGPRKGQTISLHGRYHFENGIFIVQDNETADKMTPMLEFYGAKRVTLEEYEVALAAKNAEVAAATEAVKPTQEIKPVSPVPDRKK